MEMSGDGMMEASGDGVSEGTPPVNPVTLGAFLGAVFLVFLLGVAVVVVVIVVRKRRRGRRGEWTVPGIDSHYRGKNLEAGVTNAVYGCKF